MPKVSDRHKAEVRERLLDAAQQAVVDVGIDNASTRDMLERAGLSFGSLYHYFPGGKAEVMVALAERLHGTDLAALVPEPSAAQRAADVLSEAVDALLSPGGDTLLPQLRPRATHDESIRAALLRWDRLVVDSMSELTTAAQQQGDIRADLDPAALVEAVIVFFEGLKGREAAQCFATSYPQVVAAFLAVLRAGTTPPPTAGPTDQPE